MVNAVFATSWLKPVKVQLNQVIFDRTICGVIVSILTRGFCGNRLTGGSLGLVALLGILRLVGSLFGKTAHTPRY